MYVIEFKIRSDFGQTVLGHQSEFNYKNCQYLRFLLFDIVILSCSGNYRDIKTVYLKLEA